jgi:hypothetical protein
VAIKSSLNLGLSDKLKQAFAEIKPVERSLITNQEIKDPNWLAGFASGEGCFLINIYKSQTKLGESVKLNFNLLQHYRDSELIKSFEKYLGCGSTYKLSEDAIIFIVTRISDILEKIIPFFDKYKIIGEKVQDFKLTAELMKDKAHLTYECLENIRKIKIGMNKGRISEN